MDDLKNRISEIRKVIDNTAQDVEILVSLHKNQSPSITIDALYAFTNCEVSISPNACVIVDENSFVDWLMTLTHFFQYFVSYFHWK